MKYPFLLFIICVLAASSICAQPVTKAMEDAAFKRGKDYAVTLARQFSGKTKSELSAALGKAVNDQMITDKIGDAYIIVTYKSADFDLQATLSNIDKENRIIIKSLSTYIVTNFNLVHDTRGRQPELPWPVTLPRPDLYGQNISSVQPKSSATYANYINDGISFYKEKQYEKAIERYEAAAMEKPAEATPYYNIGISYNLLKQYDKAIAVFEKAISLYGNNTESTAKANYNMAIAYYNQGNYAKALTQYTAAINLMPENGSYYAGRFFAYCRLGRDSDAAKDKVTSNTKGYQFNGSCSVENATKNNSILAAALKFYEEKKYNEAVQAYTEFIQKEPDNSAAYTNRSMAYFQLNDYVRALADGKKAEAMGPSNALNLVNISGILYNTNSFKESIVYADKAIAINNKALNAYEVKGRALLADKQYEATVAVYEFLIKEKYELQNSFIYIGSAYRSLGNTKAAIQNFSEALRINQKNIKVLQARAKLYGNEKLYKEAMQDYNTALTLQPNAGYIYMDIGILYRERGLFGDALLNLRKAVQLEPQDDLAYGTIGSVYFLQFEYEDAIKVFDTAIKINNEDAYNYFYKGRSFAGLKKYTDAIKCYETTLKFDPTFYEAIFQKSFAMDKSGDYAGAKKVLDTYILKVPDSKYAYHNRGYYNRLLKLYDESIADFSKAIKLDPKYGSAYVGRALTYCEKGLKSMANSDELMAVVLGEGNTNYCK